MKQKEIDFERIFLAFVHWLGDRWPIFIRQKGRHLRGGGNVRSTYGHDQKRISDQGGSSERPESRLQRGAFPVSKSRAAGSGRPQIRGLRRVEREAVGPEDRPLRRSTVGIQAHIPENRGELPHVPAYAVLQHRDQDLRAGRVRG